MDQESRNGEPRMHGNLLIPRRTVCAGLLLCAWAVMLQAQRLSPADESGPMSASAIPASQLVQPAELDQELRARPHARPLILQVGSRMLYNEARIPGAEYAGPASRPAGLELLRQRVATLPRDRAIVLYCGCCPWDHCPNIGPAWRLLHRMGFSHVRALYLADNFGADWVSKGYPTEKPH